MPQRPENILGHRKVWQVADRQRFTVHPYGVRYYVRYLYVWLAWK
jgi:hypothetical protein